MEPRAVERFSETMADEEPEPQMLVPYGMVNFMGISAESGRDVGRGDHVEAIFRPSVGCLSMQVAIHPGNVGGNLPSTHEVDNALAMARRPPTAAPVCEGVPPPSSLKHGHRAHGTLLIDDPTA
jgi:hypothetical protein